MGWKRSERHHRPRWRSYQSHLLVLSSSQPTPICHLLVRENFRHNLEPDHLSNEVEGVGVSLSGESGDNLADCRVKDGNGEGVLDVVWDGVATGTGRAGEGNGSGVSERESTAFEDSGVDEPGVDSGELEESSVPTSRSPCFPASST